MKYVDEFRQAERAKHLAREIAKTATTPWAIMEICGGQTHAIMKYGIEQLLPSQISLIHGPGCPVCVTAPEKIDAAIELAMRHNVIVCTFGDMVRVPGTTQSLADAKANGAQVQIVYSPLDALSMARKQPGKEFVFFAVGFETTAPTTAMAVRQAADESLANFSLLVSHVRVPPALEGLLDAPLTKIDGILAAGHVCTIMGLSEYEPIVERFRLPVVATGFEPIDILQGILLCVRQLESGLAQVENQYARVITEEGNIAARKTLVEVFDIIDQNWRGIGIIPKSGLGLRTEFKRYDAEHKFRLKSKASIDIDNNGCIAGKVLQGIKKPVDCPNFGTTCRPERPLGAPMVSSEGACAAYYRYRDGKFHND